MTKNMLVKFCQKCIWMQSHIQKQTNGTVQLKDSTKEIPKLGCSMDVGIQISG